MKSLLYAVNFGYNRKQNIIKKRDYQTKSKKKVNFEKIL